MSAADNEEAAALLARSMLEAGRPFEWTLIVLSSYFGREVALVALEGTEGQEYPDPQDC
jgi:hypothetical protein